MNDDDKKEVMVEEMPIDPTSIDKAPMPISMEQVVRKKREINPDLKNYPLITFDYNRFLMKSLAEKYKKIRKDKVFKVDDNKKSIPHDFEIRTDDFWAFVEFFPFANQYIIILFCKDLEVLNKEFKTYGVIYKPGNYYLSKDACGYFLLPIKVTKEEMPELDNNMVEKLRNDIDTFFKKKDFFVKNKLSYKRGVLLYGPPGNGKTSFIKSLLAEQKDKYGIIIESNKEFYSDTSEFLKYVLNDKQKIIIFEDIEGIQERSRSAVLNFLDGIDSIENTFFIATTNNIARLDAALINRPSRFDRIYKIDLPNGDTRKKLLKRFFPDLKGEELEQLKRNTEGFTGAYFKELYILKNLQECSIEEAIENIKAQMALFGKPETDYLG